jgi:hypothetical protein
MIGKRKGRYFVKFGMFGYKVRAFPAVFHAVGYTYSRGAIYIFRRKYPASACVVLFAVSGAIGVLTFEKVPAAGKVSGFHLLLLPVKNTRTSLHLKYTLSMLI